MHKERAGLAAVTAADGKYMFAIGGDVGLTFERFCFERNEWEYHASEIGRYSGIFSGGMAGLTGCLVPNLNGSDKIMVLGGSMKWLTCISVSDLKISRLEDFKMGEILEEKFDY